MPPERPLTEKQAQRRRRVLVAAIELAGEGGYDGVQMREVAERADVALGTVYHYFTSKDHLLAESLTEWVVGMEEAVAQRPAAGATTHQRVLDLLHRMTSGMKGNQAASAALIGGFAGRGGGRSRRGQEDLHAAFSRLLATAFADDFPDERRDQIIRTLEHVWFSCLLGWKNEWMTFDKATSDLEDTAHLLLAE